MSIGAKDYTEEVKIDQAFQQIVKQSQFYFEEGVSNGCTQSLKHDTKQAEKQAFEYGAEIGRQFAMYSSFIQIFYEDKDRIINQKVKKNIEGLKELLKQLQFKDIESIKVLRKKLIHKFNIILSMIGLKQQFQEFIGKKNQDQSQKPSF